MFDAYSVSTTLKIENLMSGPLGQIIKQLTEAESIAAKLQKTLLSLGKGVGPMMMGGGSAEVEKASRSRQQAIVTERQARKQAEREEKTAAREKYQMDKTNAIAFQKENMERTQSIDRENAVAWSAERAKAVARNERSAQQAIVSQQREEKTTAREKYQMDKMNAIAFQKENMDRTQSIDRENAIAWSAERAKAVARNERSAQQAIVTERQARKQAEREEKTAAREKYQMDKMNAIAFQKENMNRTPSIDRENAIAWSAERAKAVARNERYERLAQERMSAYGLTPAAEERLGGLARVRAADSAAERARLSSNQNAVNEIPPAAKTGKGGRIMSTLWKAWEVYFFADMAAVPVKAVYRSAKELSQSKADFENLNLSEMDNQKVYAQATALAHKNIGTTISENIKLIQDLHTATGDLNHALDLSDSYSKWSFAAKIQAGSEGASGKAFSVRDSIKALEHRGDKVLQHPEAMADEQKRQSQVYFAFRGAVSPTDYFQLSQTGKLAYTLASPEFLYGPAAAFMQSKTGRTAGRAMMTTASSLLGGHMTKKGIGFLEGLGLWDEQASPEVKAIQSSVREALKHDPEVQKYLAATGGQLVKTGGLPPWAAKILAENHAKFSQDVLYPAVSAKYNHGEPMDPEQYATLLVSEFNRNTADELAFYILDRAKVAKDTGIIGKAKDYSGAYDAYKKTPLGAEESFSASLSVLRALAGEKLMPAIVDKMNQFAGNLNSLSQNLDGVIVSAKGVITVLGWVGSAFDGVGKFLGESFAKLQLAGEDLKSLANKHEPFMGKNSLAERLAALSPKEAFKHVLETDYISKWFGKPVENAGDKASESIKTSGQAVASELKAIASTLQNLTISMDGQQVGRVVAKHVASDIFAHPGPSGFDPSRVENGGIPSNLNR